MNKRTFYSFSILVNRVKLFQWCLVCTQTQWKFTVWNFYTLGNFIESSHSIWTSSLFSWTCLKLQIQRFFFLTAVYHPHSSVWSRQQNRNPPRADSCCYDSSITKHRQQWVTAAQTLRHARTAEKGRREGGRTLLAVAVADLMPGGFRWEPRPVNNPTKVPDQKKKNGRWTRAGTAESKAPRDQSF